MKILYYTDQDYLHGGIERVLANKINYLCKHTSHEVYLLTIEQKGNLSCYQLHEELKKNDLGVNYERSLSYFHPRNILKIPRHIWLLRNILHEVKPDVVIQCNYAWDFYFMPFIARKIPKVKEYHSSRFFEDQRIRKKGRSFRDCLNKWVESKFDRLIVLNSDEAEFFRTGNVTVIPNALSFYPESEVAMKSKIVISAGRLAPVKGYDRLIEAWKCIATKCPDWQLHIYGEDCSNYRRLLLRQIETLNLSHCVKLCGPTSELKNKMLDASVYAMSSHTECFPMVLLEAMACGLPVVSFDCPCGPRNIVKDGEDGILVKNGEVKKLADALLELIQDDSSRKSKGIEAYRNILRFSPQKIMGSWESLFHELQ